MRICMFLKGISTIFSILSCEWEICMNNFYREKPPLKLVILGNNLKLISFPLTAQFSFKIILIKNL